ncbi:MAG TPA: hypothetical protein VFT84_00175 [Gemmatimonadales bacterium]|jgi:hypothetical protein|nr:hypothetical protein [Gemmatimonadales bacterium]
MSTEPADPTPPPNPSPAAIAATETPVQLTVQLVTDDRIPDGMVCMGSFRNGRLVARSVMPPEAWAQIEEFGIFDDPVQVVLVARAAPPGLQCQLYAMVPLPDDEEGEDDEEPWAASVPGAGYESAVDEDEEEEDEDEEEEPKVAPIPLGHIVRYDRDRVHPESLPLEAVDVLRKIIDGDTSEVIDRALADLLGL